MIYLYPLYRFHHYGFFLKLNRVFVFMNFCEVQHSHTCCFQASSSSRRNSKSSFCSLRSCFSSVNRFSHSFRLRRSSATSLTIFDTFLLATSTRPLCSSITLKRTKQSQEISWCWYHDSTRFPAITAAWSVKKRRDHLSTKHRVVMITRWEKLVSEG